MIAGLAPAEPGVDALVDELAEHLRALLRDVICGHLDADLRSVADELLAEAAERRVHPGLTHGGGREPLASRTDRSPLGPLVGPGVSRPPGDDM